LFKNTFKTLVFPEQFSSPAFSMPLKYIYQESWIAVVWEWRWCWAVLF